jgi:hypothetical protein
MTVLIPYKRIVINTSLSPEQTRQIMATVVMPSESLFGMFPKYVGVLVGDVTRDSFEIYEPQEGSNSLTLFLYGKFYLLPEGTQIEITFRYVTWVYLFTLFWCAPWCYIASGALYGDAIGLLFLIPVMLVYGILLRSFNLQLERNEKRILGMFYPYTIH